MMTLKELKYIDEHRDLLIKVCEHCIHQPCSECIYNGEWVCKTFCSVIAPAAYPNDIDQYIKEYKKVITKEILDKI